MLNLWIDLLTSPSWVDRFFAVMPALVMLLAGLAFVAQLLEWRKQDKVNAMRKAQHEAFVVAMRPRPGHGAGLRPGPNPFDQRTVAQRIADQRAFDESGLPRYW